MVQGYCNRLIEQVKNHYYILCGGLSQNSENYLSYNVLYVVGRFGVTLAMALLSGNKPDQMVHDKPN